MFTSVLLTGSRRKSAVREAVTDVLNDADAGFRPVDPTQHKGTLHRRAGRIRALLKYLVKRSSGRDSRSCDPDLA